MKRSFAIAASTMAVLVAPMALGADQPIPAKIGVVKTAKLAKFVAKNPAGFPLPAGPSEDPSAVGAEIAFFDTGSAGGTFIHALPAGGWKALGNPPGSKGYKYIGKQVADSVCKTVLIKEKVIKAVCKGTAVSLTTPFAGTEGIILAMPAGTTGALRYCAELGGTEKKNDVKVLKRKDAPAPAVCPSVPSVGCPLSQGRYTITTTGGTLTVATFAPFAFPAGGETIQDVTAGDASCVHDTVVPFPGGLTVPVFCVPALGASVAVTQSGCGVGRIDSDGGSDFTVEELGDTSETTVCGVPQLTCPAAGPAPDSSGRIDVTVGDGAPDSCASGGTANAIVSIPVETLTWVAADASCPDTDGVYDVGTDTLLAEFPQTLDLTTDTNTARFFDIDGDTCSRSGLGPQGPFASTGQCIDFGDNTVNIAASGTVFTSGGPTYDLLFTTVQNNTIGAPAPFGGATCPSPPLIDFDGTASRCLVAP